MKTEINMEPNDIATTRRTYSLVWNNGKTTPSMEVYCGEDCTLVDKRMHDTRRLAGQHSRQQVRLHGLSFFNSTHCTPLPYPPINLSWWSRQVEAKPPLLQQASLITDGKCANYLSVTVMVGKLWGGSCLLERYEILIQAAYAWAHDYSFHCS